MLFCAFLVFFMNSCSTDDIKPAVSLSSNSVTLSIDNNTILVTASLNDNTSNDIVVPLNFYGDAEINTHYTTSSNQIVILGGQNSGSITINYVEGNFSEESKTINISIGNVTGAITLGNTELTINIIGENAGVNFVAENFNYPSGNMLTNHGWFAHSAAGNNSILVGSSGLNFSNYMGSGIGNSALIENDGEDINKPFISNINSGDVYASFLVRVNEAVDASGEGFFLHFGYFNDNLIPNAGFSNVSTAFRGRTFVRQGTNSSTQFKLGLSFNATTPTGETSDLTIGETYLVVLKYKFIEGENNDEVSLFVFTQGNLPTSEPITPTVGPFTRTGTAGDAPALQTIALRQYSSNQNINVDGIYVREIWNLTNPW